MGEKAAELERHDDLARRLAASAERIEELERELNQRSKELASTTFELERRDDLARRLSAELERREDQSRELKHIAERVSYDEAKRDPREGFGVAAAVDSLIDALTGRMDQLLQEAERPPDDGDENDDAARLFEVLLAKVASEATAADALRTLERLVGAPRDGA